MAWPQDTLGAERGVLKGLLVPDHAVRQRRLESVLQHDGAEAFTDPVWRAIFQAILDDPELDHLPVGMDPEAARRFEILLAECMEPMHSEPMHSERAFQDSRAQMRLGAVERKLRELDRRIGEAQGEDEKQALAEEKALMAQEGRDIGPGWSHAARRLAAESRNSTQRMG